MAIQIHLNKSQLADLKAILELGPEVLGAVVEHIEMLELAPLAPAELQAAIREVIQDNPAAVDSILRQGSRLPACSGEGSWKQIRCSAAFEAASRRRIRPGMALRLQSGKN